MKKSVFLAVLAVSIFLSSSVDAAISKARAVRCFVYKSGCSMQEIQTGRNLAKRAAAFGGIAALATVTGVTAAVIRKQLQEEVDLPSMDETSKEGFSPRERRKGIDLPSGDYLTKKPSRPKARKVYLTEEEKEAVDLP